jgi:hypothetical protein
VWNVPLSDVLPADWLNGSPLHGPNDFSAPLLGIKKHNSLLGEV